MRSDSKREKRRKGRKRGASRLALFETWAAGQPTQKEARVSSRRRSHLHLEPLPLFHFHRADFAERVSSKTAPGPEFRRLHQPSLYRIPMYAAQFLDAFAFGPHVEIVEAFLPDSEKIVELAYGLVVSKVRYRPVSHCQRRLA